MDLQTAKLDVMQKIMEVSEPSLLQKIDKILEDEMVVGYTAEGNPLTKEKYNLRLAKAEEQLKSGKFVTQEELEKEVDKNLLKTLNKK